jgi:epoxyqueuosine reductase QueG
MDLRDDIRRQIERYVQEYPGNRNGEGGQYFEAPLVGFASAADRLFDEYKRIIGPFHWTPSEVLEDGTGRAGSVKGTVVCWVLPVTRETRLSNRGQDRLPSKEWARTRDLGERFNDRLRGLMEEYLIAQGGQAVAPMLSGRWSRVDDPAVGLASKWSERHAAFAAGLGTFSINGGFITPRGIAHRLGSVVTDIVLEPSRRPYRDHRENCLTYRGIKCGECIRRCPAGAISVNSHDKYRCQHYTYSAAFKALGKEFGVSVTGCGLCQTNVPCEGSIPEG